MRLALGVAGIEILAHGVILALNPALVEPIRRTRAFYRDQTAALNRFLDEDRRGWSIDTLLGWQYREDRHLGPRASYAPVAAAGRVRVGAFGNSFMRGADVAAAESWLEQVETRFPALETLNFGAAGYGNDQSLLRYRREGRGYHPSIVLIGLAPDNFRRNVNVYRRFLTPQGPPLSKPVYVVDARDSLTLIPNPLRTEADLVRLRDDPQSARAMGRFDGWYEPLVFENPLHDWSATVRLAVATWTRARRTWDPEHAIQRGGRYLPQSRAYRVTRALVLEFAATVRADSARPVIIILPDQWMIGDLRRGRAHPFAALRADFERAGIVVLDLSDALVEAGPIDSLFTQGLHYTPAGSTVIADWIAPRLLQLAEAPAR